MTFRSTRSDPMLVPSSNNPENIVCNMQGPELYVTAHDPPAQQPQAAKKSTGPDLRPNNTKMKLSNLRKVQKSSPLVSSYIFCS